MKGSYAEQGTLKFRKCTLPQTIFNLLFRSETFKLMPKIGEFPHGV